MDNKVEELKAPDISEPSAIELETIGTVEVVYTNKIYAAICNEGMIKLYFADINNNGGIVAIQGAVMTLGVLYAMQHTINDVIQKIGGMQQSKVVPIKSQPNREPLN